MSERLFEEYEYNLLIDKEVLDKSEALAMTFIEKMVDMDDVKTLIANTNDIKSRANDRLLELMVDSKVDDVWLDVTDTLDGATYRAMWLKKQKNGKAAPCDHCGAWVAGNVRRMLVANNQGPRRSGHNHQFVCMQCASTRWQTRK